MKSKQDFDKELYNRWNGRIKEKGYTRTHNPCIFIDSKCGNKWKEASAENLIKKPRKHPCPYCWKKSRRLSNKEFLKRLHKINKNNHTQFKPLEKCRGSHTQIRMIDLKNGHKFKTEVKRVLKGHSYSKPGVNKSYSHNELQNKLNKLYGKNHIIALSKNITEKHKAWFKCTKHHVTWKANVHNLLQGHGCPNNKTSHGEMIFKRILLKNNIPFKYSYKLKSNKTDKRKELHLDFYLPKCIPINRQWKNGIGIEIDGIQHRKPVKLFGGKQELIKRIILDKKKDIYCNKHHILLLRIPFLNRHNYPQFKKRCKLIIKVIYKLCTK